MTRGEDPYPGKSESEVVELAKEGNLMSRPPNVDKDVWEVMLNCWQMKPDGTRVVPCVCDYALSQLTLHRASAI